MSHPFKKLFTLFAILLAVFPLFSNAQSCYTFSYHLSLGSTDANTGGEVSRLQSYLQSIGLLDHVPTGYFGPLTKTAVTYYQNIKGIDPVGDVGPLTRSSLASECFTGSNPNPISPLYHFATIDTNLGCLEIPNDLKYNSHDYTLYGPVTEIQTYLYQNSLLYYAPTGYFGPLTQAAIKKYQSLRNIPVTGIADFPTRYTLAKETCNGTTTLTPPITYRPVVAQ